MLKKSLLVITVSLLSCWQSLTAKQYALITQAVHENERLILFTKKADDAYWSCPTFEASSVQESVSSLLKETVSTLRPKKIQTLSHAQAVVLLYVDYIMGKSITIKCRTRNIARDWTWARLEDIQHALNHQREHELLTLRTTHGAWIQLSTEAAAALKALVS
jgi:hypothetical protein